MRHFAYFRSVHQVFNLHVLRSCASSIYTSFSFMSVLITSLHLSVGRPIFRCPPTSMFSLLHLLQVFLSTWPNHLSVASLIFSPMFATPAIALISSAMIFSIVFSPIHLKILISVLCSHNNVNKRIEVAMVKRVTRERCIDLDNRTTLSMLWMCRI